MPLTLYVLCGLPFAGKSTLATALAGGTCAVVVRLDGINHERGLGLDGSAIPADPLVASEHAQVFRDFVIHAFTSRNASFE